MKTITLTLAVILTAITLIAQSPQAFQYQAIARDASGNILADRTIGIKVNILQGSQDGQVVFSETHQIQTNSFGLINLGIGKGEIRAGNFSTINWGGNSHYVRVEMDPAGGTNYELMGTSELLSVPYALYADKAGTGGNRAGEWTNDGTDVFVDETVFPGANAGIGVITPSAKIEVVMQYGLNSIFKRVNNGPLANSLFLLRRARGSLGSESPILNGDYIGQIGFEGSKTGGGYNRAAVIAVKVDGAPGSTIPGYIEFRTRDGSGIMNKNMVISSDGNVGIGIITPSRQLEITQSFQLPNTNHADTGVIYKGGNSFIHNYQSSGKDGFNTFVGINAGNFTMDGASSYHASYNTATGNYALHSNTTGYYNTANGYLALYSNTTGVYNTANGSWALSSNTTGTYNTANGYGALNSNTTGIENTANGSYALFSNTTGYENTANGQAALHYNTTGNGNTANGYEALFDNTTGSSNVAVGVSALYSNTDKSNLVAIGDSALCNNGTGATESWQAIHNTATGSKALYSNTTGFANTANGFQALYSNIWSSSNTANGFKALYSNIMNEIPNTATGCEALYSNTEGGGNTATGYQALYSNTTSYYNTANGSEALYSNTTGYANTADGSFALYSNTTGDENTVNGCFALYSNTTGGSNVAVGVSALYSNTDRSNLVAVGDSALYNNGTGVTLSWEAIHNTATGSKALFSNTTGFDNTATGYQALFSNTAGYNNTANGYKALYSNSTGNENTVNGYRALCSNTDGGENTAIGLSAGYTNTTGNQNTFVGSSADASSNNYDNCMALGNEAEVTASNKVRIGNDDITEIGGVVGWTTISDARYKKNIQNSTLGLSFIKRLHPVAYNLTFEGQKGILYNGFIAQEVETVLQEINEEFSGLCLPDNKTGRYGLRYAEFVVPLVKAVQEQQEIIENQQQQIDELKAIVGELM